MLTTVLIHGFGSSSMINAIKLYRTWKLSHTAPALGTRVITRLDLMAYLGPASNPRSKSQRLCATNCKSSTPDKLQTFRTIFGISCDQKLFT